MNNMNKQSSNNNITDSVKDPVKDSVAKVFNLIKANCSKSEFNTVMKDVSRKLSDTEYKQFICELYNVNLINLIID